MKKILAFTAMFLIMILSLSGCGGHDNNEIISQDEKPNPITAKSYEVVQVAVLSSPALEIHKDYKIFTSVDLEGMDTAQFFISNIGDESSQTTLNLGLSESFDVNSTLAIINASTGAVIFAYNPSGESGTWKTGGNIFIRSNGKMMFYRSLTIDENSGSEEAQSSAYYDADIISGSFESERGITEFNVGTGNNNLSFMKTDTNTSPRNLTTSGDTFVINREVNTFSGIIFN